MLPTFSKGDKPRIYVEIVLTKCFSHTTCETYRGSCNAENRINKGWCHFYFSFILLLQTDNGEIRKEVTCKYVSASSIAPNFISKVIFFL